MVSAIAFVVGAMLTGLVTAAPYEGSRHNQKGQGQGQGAGSPSGGFNGQTAPAFSTGGATRSIASSSIVAPSQSTVSSQIFTSRQNIASSQTIASTSTLSTSQTTASSSTPSSGASVTSSQTDSSAASAITAYSTNENWAGAVWSTTGASFTYVSATFTMPTPTTTSASSSKTQAASFWVGIDGANSNSDSIWQSGVDMYIVDGETTFEAWYEWYPAETQGFTSTISFSPGDVVAMYVNATSSSTGTCYIENETTGESVSGSATSPSTADDLVFEDAEVIMEDLSIDGGLVLVDFGSVTFSGCVAEAGGDELTLDTAGWFEVQADDESYTAVPSDISGTSFSVTYEAA